MAAVAEHHTGAATAVANAVSNAGRSPTVLGIAALVLLAVALWRGWYRPMVAAAAAFALASIAVTVLKPLFDRPRPPADLAIVVINTPSFPSTHATTTSAVAVAVLLSVDWHTRRRTVTAAVVLGAMVVLVGVCMVYLGAHWPSDILAGWVLGSAIGGGVGWLARPRPRRPASQPGRARVGHAG
jgi:membrane-associated phospholipid phosphatase